MFLPQSIKALQGSCVTIPCSFQVKEEYKTYLHSGCKAVWIDNSSSTLLDPTQETGDLTQQNCTTTFHGIGPQHNQKHFLRVECNNLLEYTFNEAGVNIQVLEIPSTPTLTPPSVSVSEGQSVSVQCSAPVPCLSLPPTLTWSPVLGDIQETLQEQPDKTYVKVSTLNFTASEPNTNLTCSAVHSRENGTHVLSSSAQITVDITYPSRNTRVTVSPSGPVTEHSNIILNCSSDANPAVQHYHWYKTDGGTHTLIGNSSVLNMKASRDTTAIFCVAQNELGTENSTVTHLHIHYPPGNTKMTVTPSGPVTEHSYIMLNCSSDANPSVFLWYKTDGGTHTLIGNSSVLNIKASRDTTAIFFPPQIVSSSNCSGDSVKISCVCETEGNPIPLIQWSFPQTSSNHFISSEPLSDKTLRSVLTVIKPQWRDPVTLVCHSNNSVGSDTQTFEIVHNSPEKQNGQEDVVTPLLIASTVILMVLVLVLLCMIRILIVRHNKSRLSSPETKQQSPEDQEKK
ncbi:myelin-associated glycoprotein-like [Boleophthalmus pectinirostris]|uniref:myelin-associated glycoprotein-like n=1 Tax=Boleophthalmus pectinirostris TaxID=150288 RepID=UPI00242B3A08|nr:myelin-associated glycoprotein-like [Boleophthalmus pectinirostris]